MSTDVIARGLAAAQARSGTTQALIRAIRRNGFFPQPIYRCPANDLATITVPAAGAVSAINGVAATSTNVPITNTARITWLGGAADKDVNQTYFNRGSWYAGGRSNNYSAYEFLHTGTQFEAQMLCSTLAGTAGNFRVLVNDRIAAMATLAGDGGNRLIRIQFPAAATRRIRIESCGGKHRGLNVSAVSEVSGTGRFYPLITVIGDSFPEATGAANTFDGEGIGAIRAIGGNCALGATGGTGLLNPGTGGKVNWQDANRLADLALNGFTDQITGTAANPLMAVVMMSINDNALNATFWGGAATYQEAINRALWTLIDHWQAQRPGRPMVIFGPTSISDTPQLDAYRMRDAAQEAVLGAGGAGANLWFIDRMTPATSTRRGGKIVVNLTGTLTSGTKTITALSSTAALSVGAALTGIGIPAAARIVSVDSASQVTIDLNANASGAQALSFQTDQAAYYTGSDGTHPNQAGHNYDALWMANELRHLILTQFA